MARMSRAHGTHGQRPRFSSGCCGRACRVRQRASWPRTCSCRCSRNVAHTEPIAARTRLRYGRSPSETSMLQERGRADAIFGSSPPLRLEAYELSVAVGDRRAQPRWLSGHAESAKDPEKSTRGRLPQPVADLDRRNVFCSSRALILNVIVAGRSNRRLVLGLRVDRLHLDAFVSSDRCSGPSAFARLEASTPRCPSQTPGSKTRQHGPTIGQCALSADIARLGRRCSSGISMRSKANLEFYSHSIVAGGLLEMS